MTIPSQKYGAFLLRISLGVILLAHGLAKIFIFTVPGTIAFFDSLGLHAIIAYLTIFGEITGGVALILGAYTRLVSLLSVPILTGATWVHIDNGWLFASPNGGWEYPLLLVILAISVFLLGSGTLAIKKIPIVDKLIPKALKG